MTWKLLEALRQRSDQIETISSLLERMDALEGRMDRDEARRSEWVGTIKRVIARINKASERADEDGGSIEPTTSIRQELDRRAQRFYNGGR